MLAPATILQPLIDVFQTILIFFHDRGAGWGVSIILMTLVVRALLLPLTLRQFRSMQALAHLQPQIKELQAKYKDDRQRLNQEMMKFYQENKVNPLGSCLPLAAQLPVFFSLFYMLRKDLRHNICPNINPLAGASNPKPCGGVPAAHFLGIPDLTSQATGTVLIVLLLLYVGSQLLSGLLMATASTDRNQKFIMLGLPFLFVVFVRTFPAGLLVYWITTNLWTIVQQYIVKRRIGPMRPPDPPGGAATGAVPAVPATAGAGDGKSGGGLLASIVSRATAGGGATNGASNGANGDGLDEVAQAPRPAGGATPPPSPRKRKKRSGRRR